MSDKINDGGPAFPFNELYQNDEVYVQHHGQSLRDKFAGDAMIGIISSGRHTPMGEKPLEIIMEDVAQTAYQMADAMIRARGQ